MSVSFRTSRLAGFFPGILVTVISLVSPAFVAGEPDLLRAVSLDAIDASRSDLENLVVRYREDLDLLERYYPRPHSAKERELLDGYLASWLESLEKLEFDRLNRDGQTDYVLLRNQVGRERERLELDARTDDRTRTLVPFADVITDLRASRRSVDRVGGQAAAGTLDELARTIHKHREGLEAESIDPLVAHQAARKIDALGRTLSEWNAFYEGYDPLFTWWVKRPYRQVKEELEATASWLRREVIGEVPGEDPPILGLPLGRKALEREIAREMIPYSPAELLEIARQEMAWCDREMLRASRDLGFADDWKAALDHVKGLHVAPGEQPGLIRKLAHEAVDFLEARDLLTIPELCKRSWRVKMMSPERQKVNPYFTGGEVITVSFPTDTMDHADKQMSLRGNNIHFSRATVHHELIPGHHLQLFMIERHRPHRQVFRTPFWIEGWALYWEMQLWDLGFPGSAEDRVGMLFWRRHRCARILFSLNYHLERWTAEECIEFLIDRVGHERNNATAEVRRSVIGGYSPLYQAAYMLGGLQIRALHRELVVGGKMSARRFHDAVLRENAIPIELIGAKLKEEPLSRDFQSSWKFYGDVKAE